MNTQAFSKICCVNMVFIVMRMFFLFMYNPVSKKVGTLRQAQYQISLIKQLGQGHVCHCAAVFISTLDILYLFYFQSNMRLNDLHCVFIYILEASQSVNWLY